MIYNNITVLLTGGLCSCEKCHNKRLLMLFIMQVKIFVPNLRVYVVVKRQQPLSLLEL